MNEQQVKQAKRLAGAGAIFFGFLIYLFVSELIGVKAGGNSTISELLWAVWARQPWIVFISSHVLAAPFWFLCGHFFAQSSDVYAQIRGDK